MKPLFICFALVFFCVVFTPQGALSQTPDCTWIPFDGSPDFTPVDVEVLDCLPDETILRITVHGMCVRDTVVGAEIYQIITVPEMIPTHELGRPALPYVAELIALSVMTDYVSIAGVSATPVDTFENFNVFPAQLEGCCGDLPPFDVDWPFYADADSFYPGTLAAGDSVNFWHVMPVANASIFPFQHNTVSDQLIAYHTIDVVLSHVGAAIADSVPRSFLVGYETLVNFDFVSPRIPIDRSRFSPYKLFIVADNLVDDPSVAKLIRYEKRKGFTTSKMSATQAAGNPPNPNHIKYTIRNLYNRPEWKDKPLYVVLIGAHAQVPAKVDTFGIVESFRGGKEDILSDSWYELMGTEGTDYIPDLMVGRLPSSNPDTVQTMIDIKIANDSCAASTVAAELLVAHREATSEDRGDGNKMAYYYKENKKLVKNAVLQLGFAATEVYGSDGGTNTDVKNAIEAGLGYVNYRGHGSETAWEQWSFGGSWTWMDVSVLNVAGKEPIVWSICCSNNRIDDLGDCIGEVWMKRGKATAHFGSSRASWSVKNSYFDRYIHEVFCNFKAKQETADIGHVLTVAKAQLSRFWKADSAKYKYANHEESRANLLGYVLLGDPEQTMWTGLPGTAVIDRPDSITTGSQTFGVTVESGGSPVDGAIVCLWKEGTEADEVFQARYTDAAGLAGFNINPQTAGDMRVTVWGQNLRVHWADVTVWKDITGVDDGRGTNFALALDQNYPNPFNPSTTICFTLPKKMMTSLSIYNIEGRLVTTLVEGMLESGPNKVTWHGKDSRGNAVSTGVYLCRLKAGNWTLTRKMVVLK